MLAIFLIHVCTVWALLRRSQQQTGHARLFARPTRSFDLSLYALVFFLIRTPSVIDRFWPIFADGALSPGFIQGLHAFCSPLQGFCNCVLLWRSQIARRYIKRSIDMDQIDAQSYLDFFGPHSPKTVAITILQAI